ncbi:MAG: 30S ribosome-binding factor RbfA [Candidatus Marinimicrobia bacterium]|nr:30S ribosome-binding factor RbfA [Candidatus Neomarinimicrobiota bacterium]
MSFSRVKRVSDELQKILSEIIVVDDPFDLGTMVTISKVELSKDFKQAKVYISIYDENSAKRDEVINKLREKAGKIRYELGRKVRLKYIPRLIFYEDETLQYVERIENIIKELKYSDNEDGNE